MAYEPSVFFNMKDLKYNVPPEVGIEIFKHVDLGDMSSVALACKEGAVYQGEMLKGLAIRLGARVDSVEASREFVQKVVERVREVMDFIEPKNQAHGQNQVQTTVQQVAEKFAKKGQLSLLCPWLQRERKARFKAIPSLKGAHCALRDQLLRRACENGNAADLILAWVHKGVIMKYHLRDFCNSEDGLKGVQELNDYGFKHLNQQLLQAACETGQLEIVDYILGNGGHLKESFLLDAAEYGQAEVLEVLNNRGLDVDFSLPALQRTALHYAAMNGHDGAVETLIDLGADVNALDTGGESPAVLAVKFSNWDCLNTLLSSGANPSVRVHNGTTLLHMAIRRGHAPAVKALVDAGAQLEDVDVAGYTPLQLCAERGAADCLKLLLEAGAKPSTKNRDHKTALDLAIESNHPECEALLRDVKYDRFNQAISQMVDLLAYLHR